MEPTKPKLPSDAIELYNLFIHGVIGRRAFMDGVKRFAVGGLTTAAIIDALMPNYAQGQQVSKTDDRIKATYETVPSPQGNGSIKGYLVRPASADTRTETPAKLPGIIVIHENRGLNPHIEDIARRLALANFMAFAPDGLTSLGGFPGDDFRGGQMFGKVDGKKMAEDFVAAALWLKSRAGLLRQNRRHGFLLRRRHLQHPGRPPGSRYRRRSAVLWRRSREGRHLEDQGGDSGPSRRARHAAGLDLARLRHGLDVDKRSARRLYLPRRRSRLQLRCHAGALQQSCGRPGLAAHHRLVQQIHAGYRPPCS